ncbi:MAG: acyl-CoA thioesterase [Bacteroidales bacterium]|nr:acyl-CoA thioesterase [Bacteroidales bacterium]MDE6082052.1 acyl-CoA thioesterase [Muribaculaceae bacterium]
MEQKYIYGTEIDVRDYELDAEGIVNNANYLHYLEHTRHEFCKIAGFTFAQMRENGIDPVLRKVEIEYLTPLKSGDTMESFINMERKGPRFIFHQDIFRKSDGQPVVKALVTVVMLKNGKLSKGDEVAEAFHKYL